MCYVKISKYEKHTNKLVKSVITYKTSSWFSTLLKTLEVGKLLWYRFAAGYEKDLIPDF